MSLIKSPQELASLRIGGKILGDVIATAAAMVKPGVNVLDIDTAIHHNILKAGAKPSFLGFDGFPNASCLSVNDEIVHGIPKDRILMEGDIIGIDVGLWYKGLCTDSATTVPVGTVDSETERLLATTEIALLAGIKAIKPFQKVGTISYAIQQVADAAQLGIIRGLTGHGVGHDVHEDPSVPNIGRPTDGILLRPGMVLAIEPMFSLGSGSNITDIDGWTIRTSDGKFSAQFEHTVIITNRGAEIITPRPLQQKI